MTGQVRGTKAGSEERLELNSTARGLKLNSHSSRTRTVLLAYYGLER